MAFAYASTNYALDNREYNTYYSNNSTLRYSQQHYGAIENPTQQAERPPLSSFARTMLEQDFEFFQHFPDAREAAIEQWSSYGIPTADLNSLCLRYRENNRSSEHYPGAPPALIRASPNPVPVVCERWDEASPSPGDYVGHDYQDDIVPPRDPPPLEQAYYYADSVDMTMSACNTPQSMCDSRSPSPFSPPTPIQETKTQYIVPSQHRQVGRAYSQPLAAPAYRPQSARSRSVDYLRALVAAEDYTAPSPSVSPALPKILPPSLTFVNDGPGFQVTGNWSADAIVASERLLHAPAPRHANVPEILSLDHPVVEVPPTRRHHLTYRQRKGRPKSYPSAKAKLSTRASRGSIVAKGKDKDVKPPLACFFCRARKIACKSPGAESEDRTCNQCQKRGHVCTYPLESRRGMRKKPEDIEAELAERFLDDTPATSSKEE